MNFFQKTGTLDPDLSFMARVENRRGFYRRSDRDLLARNVKKTGEESEADEHWRQRQQHQRGWVAERSAEL